MPTQPRSPSEHYAEAVRLLDVADQTASNPDWRRNLELVRLHDEAVTAAGVYATLALAPRRARRRRSDRDDGPPLAGSPRHRWLYGPENDQ